MKSRIGEFERTYLYKYITMSIRAIGVVTCISGLIYCGIWWSGFTGHTFFLDTVPLVESNRVIESGMQPSRINVAIFNTTPNELSHWIPPVLPVHLGDRDQKDPELIEHIRQHWIIPPFEGPIQLTRDGNITPDSDNSQHHQPTIVNDLLGNRTYGFYIEAGAANGERHSNSLLFELYHHWDGLLVEPNPAFFKEILQRKRRVFVISACLSPTTKPQTVEFTTAGIAGGISDLIPEGQKQMNKVQNSQVITVQCFPLYSILAALGVRHVDYFSLDIEGPEIEVLSTLLPLREVQFDVLTIEKRVMATAEMTKEQGTHDKVDRLRQLLIPYGYKEMMQLDLDIIFRTESLN